MSAYLALKLLHISTVVVTGSFFALRGIWMMTSPERLRYRWVRVLPHVNDSLLLASALGLAITTGQYPFEQSWLTAKVLALVAYIILGSIAIRYGRTRKVRISAWIAALLVFSYIIAVACTRSYSL